MARVGKKEERSSGGSMRDRMRQRLEERKSENTGGGTVRLPDGIEFFSPEKGTYEIDIFPYIVSESRNPDGVKAGEEWHRRIYWIHRNIGDEDKRYVCLKSIGKPCPICAEYALLSKDKNTDPDVVKALKPSERELYNVLINGKQYVFDMSSYLFGRIIEDELRNVDEQYLDFPMLKGGYTLKVRFGEKKLGKNAFLEAQRIDFVDREDLSPKYLDKAVDLDKALNILTAEQLKAILFGTDVVQDNDDDEEEETPPRRNTNKEETPVRRRRVVEEEEEQEEEEQEEEEQEEEEQEEEEQEEEKPAPRGRKPASQKNRKDQDDDEETSEKCPNGFKWGKDNDAHDECDKCKQWEECADEKDRLKREERGGRRRA